MKYINIWKLSFKTETEYEYFAVTTPEELKVALCGGFQLVIEKFGASWFRRPKCILIAGTPIIYGVPPEMLCSKQKQTAVNIYHNVSGEISRASSPSPSFSSWEMLYCVNLCEEHWKRAYDFGDSDCKLGSRSR